LGERRGAREPKFTTYLLRLIEKYIRLRRFLQAHVLFLSIRPCTEANVTAP
jgi:hypothetical protein